MPGSIANPVMIGPWHRIVSVHWNSIRYIALRCIWRTLYAGQLVSSSGSVPAFDPASDVEIPAADWLQTYIVFATDEGAATVEVHETSYELEQFGTRYFSAAYAMREGSGWGPLEEAEVDASGIPHAEFTFVETITTGEGHTLFNVVFPDADPNGWQTSAGGRPDIEIPEAVGVSPGQHFDKAPSADWVISHNAVYTQSFYWGHQTPGPLIGYGAYASPQTTEFYRKTWNAADIVTVYKGKAFRGVAINFDDNVGGLWVLCERSKSDDPS
ncbi:hypothetical protein [Mesorhizobium sp. B2-6-5]|uniref:hypothetical protein n=1 Tax=Mesorhizobium sp. B2-6-5 TaxID=2589912 RepID=UPI0011260D04|nr:hypothetical protein [Mesorhizobium sp. B2-6-5]TPJ34263.1 hypothetical protein FJ432_30025 [Mesorhizobium sp. B2-6-5]